MASSGGKSLETDSQTALAPESSDEPAGFTEADLALIDALQAAPRAPWSRIGRALGVDATTAARRWERLRERGLAWITAYDAAGGVTVAHVEIRCRPRRLAEVSNAVRELPWVFSVDETAGDFDLFVSVGAPDLPAIGRAVHEVIGGLRGVRSTRIRLAMTLYGEGRDWSMRAMEPVARAALGEAGGVRRVVHGTRRHDRRAPEDEALLTALGQDGRTGFTELAARTGLSEHAARRRVQRMLREGDITLRCDLAQPLAGLRTTVIYRTNVPHAHVQRVGDALARLAQVRLCCSVSGPNNLLVMVWLHGLEGVDPFETMLAERFPELEVKDRTVVLRSPKRMGWILDEWGRATRRVPLGPP